MSDEAVLNAEDFEVDYELQACEFSLEVDLLEAKVEKLELENGIMRKYIEHQNEIAHGWPLGGLLHKTQGCDVCSRVQALLRPNVPWRGWVL